MPDVIVWRGDAPAVAQVTRVRITGGIIGEGTDLYFAIGGKVVKAEATADSRENLLQQGVTAWNASEIPEFTEVTASYGVDLAGDPYIDLTADTPGKPFEVTVTGPYPTVNVDTIQEATPGADEVQQFYFPVAPTSGTYAVEWDLGNGTETSAPVPFNGNAQALKNSLVSGMSSLSNSNITVSGAGTFNSPFVLSLSGSMGKQNVNQLTVDLTSLSLTADVDVQTIQTVGGNTREVQLIWVPLAFINDINHSVQFSADNGATWSVWTDLPKTVHGVGAANIDSTQNQFQTAIQNVYGKSVSVEYFLNGRRFGTWDEGAIGTVGCAVVRFNSDGSHPLIQARLGGPGGVVNCPVRRLVTGGGGTNNFSAVVVKQRTKTGDYSETTTVTGRAFIHDDNTAGSVFSGPNVADPTPAQIEGLASIGNGNCQFHSYSNVGVEAAGFSVGISGERELYIVEFIGSLAGANQPVTQNYAAVDGGGPQAIPYGTKTVRAVSAALNEIQQVIVTADGGTFTLHAGGTPTSALAWNISAANLKTALEGLTEIGASNVNITGTGSGFDPFLIEFVGGLALTNVPLLVANSGSLTLAPSVSVLTVTNGSPGTGEVWRVELIGATGGTYRLEILDQITAEIAYDAAAATVQAALENLPAVGSGGVVVSGDAGGPFTVTAAGALSGIDLPQMISHNEGLTGTGQPTIAKTTVVRSTGPAHADEPLNYSTGSLPEAGDTLVFIDSRNDCLYGLNIFHDVVFALLVVDASFTGKIGLSRFDEDLGYYQYRLRELQVGATLCQIGFGSGGGSSRVRLNFMEHKTQVNIGRSAQPEGDGYRAITLYGTHAENEVNIIKGSVDIAPDLGRTSTVNKLRVAFLDNRDGDVDFLAGPDVVFGEIEVNGGSVTLQSDTDDIHATGGTIVLLAGQHDAIDITNATLDWRTTGEIGELDAKDSTIICEKDPRPKSFAALEVIQLTGDTELRDRLGTLPDGVQIRRVIGTEKILMPGGKVYTVN